MSHYFAGQRASRFIRVFLDVRVCGRDPFVAHRALGQRQLFKHSQPARIYYKAPPSSSPRHLHTNHQRQRHRLQNGVSSFRSIALTGDYAKQFKQQRHDPVWSWRCCPMYMFLLFYLLSIFLPFVTTIPR